MHVGTKMELEIIENPNVNWYTLHYVTFRKLTKIPFEEVWEKQGRNRTTLFQKEEVL